MNPKRLLPCLAAILLASPLTYADTIAKWTFEFSQPAGTPGAGIWITNIAAEVGVGTAAGLHAGNATYSSVTGNGSSKALSSALWAVGDCYQFAVSSVGFQNLLVSFDVTRSSTGPGNLALQYSTDGSTFTQFGSTFLVLTNGTGAPAWSSSTAQTAYTMSVDLSSVGALNNSSVVYFRLVDATAPTSTAGTLRVDNFNVSATTIAGLPSITIQPQASTAAYWGDTVVLNVTATGTAPLGYQWYSPDLNSPLSNGSSGYGAGTISGSTTNILYMTYTDPNQAGNYQVVITNSLGAVTSQIAHLTVNVRTPIVTNIAYLRTLQNPTNWTPIDITNIYSVTGIVTTPFNISGSGNSSEFFVQDNTAGICVFVGGGGYLPNRGDRVQVTGPLGAYSGLLEFNMSASNPSHSLSLVNSGNTLPAAKYFDINNYANIPYMENNIEGSLIIVSNVFLNQSSLQFATGAINITNVNRKYISLYVSANAFDVIGQNVPTIASSIVGVMGQFTSTVPATNGYQLYLLEYSDLVPTTVVPPMPLQIQKTGTNVVVSWWAVAPFTLQAAPDLTGTFTNIDGASTPFTNGIDNAARFYRLKQN